jgi:hypothetical protein
MAGISWGDVPGWLGALGALVVGGAAVVISIAQFRIAEQQTQIAQHQARIAEKQFEHERFRPLIKAYCDEERRVAVQVVNQGAGSGQVQDLNLIVHGDLVRMRKFEWEMPEDTPPDTAPVPFLIGGLQTAQLVVIPEPELDLGDVCVRIDYGDGSRSDLIELIALRGRIHGTTAIPGQR